LGMVFYLVAFLLRRRAPPSTPFPYPPLSRSLQVLPAQSAGATPKIITLVRNEIKLEERAAQGKLMEVPTKDGTRRIGVVKLPAFYMDFAAADAGKKDYRSTTRDVRRISQDINREGIVGLVIDCSGYCSRSLRVHTVSTRLR